MKKLTEALKGADATWEVDRMEMMETSTRRAWLAAKFGWGVAALSVVGTAAMAKMREVVFVPIVVDKTTGETTVGQRLAEESVPAIDALDKKCASEFVRARYGYDWHMLKRDYDTVARMATGDVFASYNELYFPKLGKGQQDRWGDGQLHRIEVISRRLTGDQAGGGKGIVVTYDKTSIYRDGSQPPQTTRHAATLVYVYQPKVLVKEQDRVENPFGWICTACRSDPITDRQGGA